MDYYDETIEITGPFDEGDPMERLIDFYLANDYRLVPEAAGGAEGSGEPVVLERGTPGRGWWTSKMTNLHTRLVAERVDEQRILLEFRVDVRGQVLGEEERSFWRREARHAGHYVSGQASEPRDTVSREADRVAKQRKRLITYSMWGTLIVFLVGVALIVLDVL